MGKLTEGLVCAKEGRERVVDVRGEARGGASMVNGGLQVDFGRGGAQTGSRRVVGGEGRGYSAWGAANRDGVASFGRCDERRRLELVSALREREEGQGSRRDGKLRGLRDEKSGAQM